MNVQVETQIMDNYISDNLQSWDLHVWRTLKLDTEILWFFGFRMVYDTAFGKTANRFACMRRKT